MKKRRYVVWGLWTALAAPLLALIAVAVILAISYDGSCGGFLPWLAAAKPCSFVDYVFGNLTLLALIFWVEFWPIIIVVLALPVGVGYMLDRRTARNAAKP
jgi:hypothetical protein